MARNASRSSETRRSRFLRDGPSAAPPDVAGGMVDSPPERPIVRPFVERQPPVPTDGAGIGDAAGVEVVVPAALAGARCAIVSVVLASEWRRAREAVAASVCESDEDARPAAEVAVLPEAARDALAPERAFEDHAYDVGFRSAPDADTIVSSIWARRCEPMRRFVPVSELGRMSDGRGDEEGVAVSTDGDCRSSGGGEVLGVMEEEAETAGGGVAGEPWADAGAGEGGLAAGRGRVEGREKGDRMGGVSERLRKAARTGATRWANVKSARWNPVGAGEGRGIEGRECHA